jgi:hypothetical protein
MRKEMRVQSPNAASGGRSGRRPGRIRVRPCHHTGMIRRTRLNKPTMTTARPNGSVRRLMTAPKGSVRRVMAPLMSAPTTIQTNSPPAIRHRICRKRNIDAI